MSILPNSRSPAKLLVVFVLLLATWAVLTKVDQGPVAAKATPALPAPKSPLSVFHLGHSLVGRDMPAMLQQLAGPGHRYDVQLGWGTPLKAHWEPDIEINGFAQENAHERYRDAKEALQSGDYDVFVATEMVEIRDAIEYHASAEYLQRWATLARAANPDIRIYLYETWPRTDDAEGWLQRLDRDLSRYWQEKILRPAQNRAETAAPIYLIPAGQTLAAFVRALESAGGIDNIADRYGLFTKDADGIRDNVHLNDLGIYLVALTHYAVLTHQSPVGLPRQLLRADGSKAIAPGENAARLMQEIVWQVVTSLPETGVPQRK